MVEQTFRVLIEKDEDGVFVASIPSLPGCHTQGKTFEEALDRSKKAVSLYLEVRKEEARKVIPQPSFIGVENITVRYA